METIIKLCGVELLQTEIERAFTSGRIYLIKSRDISQIFFSTAQKKYYTHHIYHERGCLPLMNKGRFKLATAAEVNDLVNFKLLND